MTSDRRRYPRIRLSLNAQINDEGWKNRSCIISDFCTGGMMLGLPRAGTAKEPSYQVGQRIRISFTSPVQGVKKNFEVLAKVARAFPGGIGIAFIDIAPNALRALHEAANTPSTSGLAVQGTANQPQRETKIHLFVQGCDPLLHQFLSDLGNELAAKTPDFLLEKIDTAKSNLERQQCLEALRTLSPHLPEFGDRLYGLLRNKLGRLTQTPSPQPSRARDKDQGTELTLVDGEEFEIWVSYAGIVSRLEANNQAILFEVEQRLSYLLGYEARHETNPLGPHAIVQALRIIGDAIPIALSPRLLLIGLLERLAGEKLPAFFNALTRLLVELDILPAIDRRHLPPTQTPPEGVAKEKEAPANLPEQATSSAPRQVPAVPTAEARTAPIGRVAPPDILGTTIASLVQLLDRCTNLPSASRTGPAPEYYSQKDVLTAVTMLQDERLNIPPAEIAQASQGLSQALAMNLRRARLEQTNALELSPQERNTLLLVESLMDSATEEAKRADAGLAAQLLPKFQLPVLGAAISDHQCLYQSEHPVQEVLNTVERLASICAEEPQPFDRTIVERLNDLVDWIQRQSPWDESVFTQVLDDLRRLSTRQENIIASNVQRLIATCEGQEQRREAQTAIDTLLDGLAPEGTLPEPVLLLWNNGWRELLQFVFLRSGRDSSEWQQLALLLEQLTSSCRLASNITELRSRVGREKLLSLIGDKMADLSIPAATIDQTLAALDTALQRRSQGQRIPEVAVTPSPEEEVKAPVCKTRPGPGKNSALSLIEAQGLQQIKPGDWFVIGMDKGKRKVGKLVWISADRERYVLANRKGLRLMELSSSALAEGLGNKTITHLGNLDLPLFQRISTKLMTRIQQQIAHQATHDDLTGLPNRTELERRLDRFLTQMLDHPEQQHCLCQINLDHFEVINHVCGYTVGDDYLRSVGDLVRSKTDEKGVLGRLGANEFLIVWPNSDADRGFLTADALRQEIGGQKVLCKGRRFGVSASLGLVPFTSSKVDTQSLLSNASRACAQAKKDGRNRTHVCGINDNETRILTPIDLVPLIDQALEEGLFRLRCQPITPTGRLPEAQIHYEILLGWMIDMETPTGPYEIVRAAEQFGRAVQIDTWVLATVLDWIKSNSDFLQGCGGFSINLSGASLSDPVFRVHLLNSLQQPGIPLDKIGLEVTETSSITYLPEVERLFRELKYRGCSFYLDDFGTGFASFQYLQNLPFDYIKIDGSFVKRIANEPNDWTIVKSIADLARYLGKKTVAEHVSDQIVFDTLRDIGVDYVQGYHISEPFWLDELPGRHLVL